jgi:hypothetical protein
VDDIGETVTRRSRTDEVDEEGLDMTPSARAKGEGSWLSVVPFLLKDRAR